MSRETRRLLITALLAILTLWALARVRFPDRPPAPNPVPPILDQLTGPPTFADLASRVAELRGRVADTLVAVVLVRDQSDARPLAPVNRVPALRIRDDLAAAVIARGARDDNPAPLGAIAEDRASGLTLVQTATASRPVLPIFWSPREIDQPRYLIASSTSPGELSLRPVFIGSLTPVEIAQWAGMVWALPADVLLSPGALLFTETGELVGVVARYDIGAVVVPSRTLLAAAERLLEEPQKVPADLGVEVDGLTPRLAVAAGAETGVVVTWVDPTSVAASLLAPGDVIQAVDDVEIRSAEQWRVRAARVGVGDTLVLQVTRKGAQRLVTLAIAAAADEEAPGLGLAMRPVAGVGAEIMRVQRGSAADSAGMLAGDLITAVGEIRTPSPAQVRRAFASMEGGQLAIVGVRRGGAHRVIVIQR